MALGGGTFTSQNKVLPGSYINFVSVSAASPTLSDRGTAAMPLELNWGTDNEIFTVTQEDFQKNSLKIFGYEYTADELKGLRDLFLNTKTLYAYKLTSGGNKASNTYATAKHCGTRGNDLKIVISANADTDSNFDVTTYLNTSVVDKQTNVSAAKDLIDNDFVDFNKSAELTVTAGMPLTGGTNGTVDGNTHQKFINLIESYSFNTLGAAVADETTKKLYTAFTKRMRDDVGLKFQTVLYNCKADYEGVINVKNKVTDSGANEASLVYWVTGAECACAVNSSVTNKTYDGEFTVFADYTQSDLEKAIKNGEFTFHKVGNDINVLTDISSLTTLTEDKNELFQSNQTVRVCDQIGNDIAVLFNTKYIGKIPNDKSGRVSLWTDITKYMKELLSLRAIEDFTDDDVTVSEGQSKKAVVVDAKITVVNAMEKLYMTVRVA